MESFECKRQVRSEVALNRHAMVFYGDPVDYRYQTKTWNAQEKRELACEMGAQHALFNVEGLHFRGLLRVGGTDVSWGESVPTAARAA